MKTLRYLLTKPHDALYHYWGRLRCKLSNHNVTCRGRQDHPRQAS